MDGCDIWINDILGEEIVRIIAKLKTLVSKRLKNLDLQEGDVITTYGDEFVGDGGGNTYIVVAQPDLSEIPDNVTLLFPNAD